MKSHVERLQLTREAGRVIRSHTNDQHHYETNGEHTYNVTNILLLFHPNPSVELLKAAQFHDVPERITGDAPSTAKRWFPSIKQALLDAEKAIVKEYGIDVKLTDDELNWLKAADKLDYMLQCAEEIGLGNSGAKHRYLRAKAGITGSNTMPEAIRNFAESHNVEAAYELTA